MAQHIIYKSDKMLSLILTFSSSKIYNIVGVGKNDERVTFAQFNLEPISKHIKPENINEKEFEPGYFDHFELERPDGTVLTTQAPKHVKTISFKISTTKNRDPVAFEVTQSSSRKSNKPVTTTLNVAKELPAPHYVPPPPQEGGFSIFHIAIFIMGLMFCCRMMGRGA